MKWFKGKVIRKTVFFHNTNDDDFFIGKEGRRISDLPDFCGGVFFKYDSFKCTSRTDVYIKYWFGTFLKRRRFNLYKEICYWIPGLNHLGSGIPPSVDKYSSEYKYKYTYLFFEARV